MSRIRLKPRLRGFRLGTIFLGVLFALSTVAAADQVIMKDGTVYKGKILIDTDKAILIGNPPYDPTSYLLESDDIAKIIYEQYRQPPPSERRRGFLVSTGLTASALSSPDLSMNPAMSLFGGAGFRVHPVFELEGSAGWTPARSAKDTLLVSDGTVTREYSQFWAWDVRVGGRLYPFFKKPWKTEPYFSAGYLWSRLTPKGSGDRLKGGGWLIGVGAIHPLATHWFLETRLDYESIGYDTIQFLGREGQVRPEINQHVYALTIGLSYRL